MAFITGFCISLVCFVFSAPAFSLEPKIDGDIANVISSDSWKDTQFSTEVSPNYRFRAIQFDPLKSESEGILFLEKLYKEGTGSPYKVRFSTKVNLLSTKQIRDEFKKLPFESTIGCCQPTKIRWEGFKLLYDLSIKNKYKCVIPDVNKNLTPKCKVVK